MIDRQVQAAGVLVSPELRVHAVPEVDLEVLEQALDAAEGREGGAGGEAMSTTERGAVRETTTRMFAVSIGKRRARRGGGSRERTEPPWARPRATWRAREMRLTDRGRPRVERRRAREGG